MPVAVADAAEVAPLVTVAVGSAEAAEAVEEVVGAVVVEVSADAVAAELSADVGVAEGLRLDQTVDAHVVEMRGALIACAHPCMLAAAAAIDVAEDVVVAARHIGRSVVAVEPVAVAFQA